MDTDWYTLALREAVDRPEVTIYSGNGPMDMDHWVGWKWLHSDTNQQYGSKISLRGGDPSLEEVAGFLQRQIDVTLREIRGEDG